MAKRIRPRMVQFAEILGAVTKRGPDWYLVAEHLAASFIPELLEDEPTQAKPGPGRPQNQDDFLAMEVNRVMSAYKCGWLQACRKIARGDKVPLMPGRKGKPAYTKGSRWKGQNAKTLEKRYERWLAREKQRQQALKLTVNFS